MIFPFLSYAQIKDSIDIEAVEIIGHSSSSIQILSGTATKIERKEVELISPLGTQEILQHVPGVTAVADDGIGNSRISVGIRGLNPRRSSHILILEDGIPIQPALYIYPNVYYNPPVERLDGIEIIKGSGAIKYGPQTMGGVINYITHRPRSTFGGLAQATVGTNNFYSFFTEIGGWGTKNIFPEIQLLYKSGDGFRDNNHFNQLNGTFKVSLVLNEKTNIYIKANINHEFSHATYTGLTEYSFYNNPEFNPKEDDTFEVFRASLDILGKKQVNTHIISTTKAYTNYFNRQWWRENDVFVDADTYTGDTVIPVPWYNSGDLIRTGNGESDYGNLRSFYVAGFERSYNIEYTLGPIKVELETGARLYWDRFIDVKKTGSSPDDREGVYYTTDTAGTIIITGQSHHYETRAFSSYLIETFQITEKFILTPGCRFEAFEQERIDLLNGSTYLDKTTLVLLPGIGFNYQVSKINVFGGIHKGFTPPSSSALIILNFGSEDTGLDLLPELSWNSELGFRGYFPFASFEICGFHLLIDNLVAAGKGTTFQNLGKVRTAGIEGELHIHLDNLIKKLRFLPQINVSYTYLYTEILSGEIYSALATGIVSINGNELPYAPHHSLTAGISKEFKFSLSFNFDMQYVSTVYTDFENINYTANRGDQGPIPTYTIYNASALYKLNKHWQFSFSGKNLADNIYIGSRLHSNPAQPEANISSGILPGNRRQLNVGIKYAF